MEIREAFDQLVTALETNHMDLLEEVFDENIEIDSSALGNMRGMEQAKERLAWKGEDLDFAKIRIFNNVIRKRGDFASQSVFFVIIIGKEIHSFMNHFQCAFLNAIEYRCIKGKWKIVKIKSNMTFECGNSLLVADSWRMMDYGKFDGNDLHLIDAHKNSPWELVPETDEELCDEEKVMQCFRRYNWMIDTDDSEHLIDITTENVFAPEMGHTCRRDWIDMMREKRRKMVSYNGKEMPKEACWNHISSFKSLEINGHRAIADIYRFEPNRIGSRFIHKYNINTLYYSCTWHMEFVKDSGGEWKMDKFGVVSGIVEDSNETDRRYF